MLSQQAREDDTKAGSEMNEIFLLGVGRSEAVTTSGDDRQEGGLKIAAVGAWSYDTTRL
jgi:hypothetical protein